MIAEGDRQIVVAAFLGHVRRSEIDREPFGRQGEARCDQRRAPALLAFRHRLVAKADQHEVHAAGAELNLHVDGAGLDALERNSGDTCDHIPAQPCCTRPRNDQSRKRQPRGQPVSPGDVLRPRTGEHKNMRRTYGVGASQGCPCSGSVHSCVTKNGVHMRICLLMFLLWRLLATCGPPRPPGGDAGPACEPGP